MYRILMIAVAALTLSACGSSGAPTQPLSPSVAAHDDEPVPDANCRSGWSVANGRCL
jgi:hypothetical protein